MILIGGATGLVGAAIVNEFERRNEPVRILTRDASHATHYKDSPTVEIATGDMDRGETLIHAFNDVDRAMLISSADPVTMAETQKSFIDAAKKAGVGHIIKLSALNPDRDSPACFLRMHAEVEQYLEDSGIAWTHIRPAHFMQMYLLNAPTVVAQDAFFMPMGDAHVAPVDIHDIAKVFYAVGTGTGHEGKVYEMSGPESITMNDMARRLSEVLGRTINYQNITPEQLRQQLVSFGLPARLADAINELYAERRKGSESHLLLEAHKMFAIEPTTFANFVAQDIVAFGGAE